MEKLLSSAQRQKTEYGTRIYEVIIAVLLGFGFHKTMVTSLGLNYRLKTAFSGGLWSGFVSFLNRIADYIGNKDYIILPQYKGGGEKYGLYLSIMLLFMIAVSYLIVKSRNRWLLLIYVIPPIVIAFAWHSGPSPVASAILLGALIMAYSFFKMTQGFSWINIVIIAVVMALAFGVSSMHSVQHFFGAGPVAKVRNGEKSVIETMRYGTGNVGKDSTAMTVAMENPHEMWLRGYVGEEYGSKGWIPFDNSAQYAYLPVANAMKADHINALGQLQQSGGLLDKEDKTGKVQINVKKASSKYIYIPYELADYTVEGSKNYGNSFLQGTGLRGNRSYTYKAGTDLTSKWTDLVGEYYTAADPSEALKSYMKKEEYLNIDAYSRFRKLDDDTALVLYGAIGEPGDQSKGHIDYRTVIEKVQGFAADNMIYKAKPKYKDHSISSILEKKIGNDRDYASVATAMFRYYGVPARYVEGYQVTKDDVKKMSKDKPYPIKGSNFHAWTEIYMDGIGWVPIETVPQFMDRMTQPDMAVGLQNEDMTNKFQPKLQQPPDEKNSVRSEHEENNSRVKLKTVMALSLLLILIILAAVFAVRKLMKLVARRKAFNNPDKKMAVCAIYSEIIAVGKRIPDDIRETGEKAAYSSRQSTEEERIQMLNHWKECRRRRYS